VGVGGEEGGDVVEEDYRSIGSVILRGRRGDRGFDFRERVDEAVEG
jgi:hypothetical protein